VIPLKETLSYRQLQSLIYVSNVLNSSLDADTIIDSIMQVTISVIDAADGGVLFLYDPEQDHLIAKSTHGFNPMILNQVHLKPGESMTGLTFLKRQCLIFSDQQDVMNTTSSLSEKNLRLMENSIPHYPHSTICAPILLKEDCIGVITIDSFSPERTFTEDDIKLLTAISHQAAVAIEKARLYKEKEQAVHQLETLNNRITAQNALLSRSVEIHQDLANLVLQRRGLDEIIRCIHQKIGHEMLLFDDVGELKAYAYDSLSRQDVGLIQHFVLANIQSSVTLRSSKEMILHEGSCPVILLPIGTKPELYGLLAIAASHQVNEVDIAALEHACTVISLELVKEQALFDAQQKVNSEFIEDLFKGRVDDSLIRQAKHLHLDPRRKYMVVNIQMDDTKNEVFEVKLGVKRYLVRLANRIFIKKYPLGLVVTKHNQIVIILSFPVKDCVSYHQRQVTQLVQQFLSEMERKSWDFRFSAGVGRIKDGLEDTYKSAHEAQKCLNFIKSYSVPNKVIHYGDLGVQRLLLQNTEEELIEFILEILGPLLQYEQFRKGELMPTLLLYLENNQQAKETAEALHIHANTLNYRLKRIKEILAADFTNTEQFFDIHLAVKLYRYLENKIHLNALAKA
jgi:sugar diacid utilization regulator